MTAALGSILSTEEVALAADVGGSGSVVQTKFATLTAMVSTAVNIPLDNTVPLITEGADSGISLAFTPTDAGNKIRLSFSGQVSASKKSHTSVSIWQDSTCIAARSVRVEVANNLRAIAFEYMFSAPGTDPVTYTVRFGANTGTGNLGGSVSNYFSGLMQTTLIVSEVAP